jgi:hypothetical protein
MSGSAVKISSTIHPSSTARGGCEHIRQ